MTYSSDWATAFAQLAAAGVHVRAYSPDASPYIHAKVIVVDGTTAFVGSENFSDSSLEYNRELGLITKVPALVTGITQVVEADYAGGAAFAGSTPSPATPAASGAWCQATATPASDGYSGDYDVSVTSDQPDAKATASDPTDSWSDSTNGSGSVVILLYYTHPGESITIDVGGASCMTTA